MTQPITTESGLTTSKRLRRFLLVLLGLAGFYLLLTCVTPPDPVVQRNLEHDIDATPLFYTDSDRVPELEQALREDGIGLPQQ